MKTQKHIILAGNTAWSMYNFRGKLMQALVANGYRVTVLAPYDIIFTQKLLELSVDFIDTPFNPKSANPIEGFRLFQHYKRIFKREKPDFAFFYTIKPNIFGSLAAHRCKIPHIAVTTGLGYVFNVNNWISKISKILYKIAFKTVYQVWFLNDDDQHVFLSHKLINKKRTFVLKGEGADLERFQISSLQKNEPCTFLLIARMLWDKGVGEFVEAAHILKQKYPDTKFQLLGFLGVSNPMAIHKEQMDQWHDEGVVDYLGATEDVKPFIDAATCVVLPTWYREGIPFALLEAAASGKPTIASNSVGSKETVDDGVTGFLCNPKDPASLAVCMEKIIALSPEQYKDMALAGRAKMEREFDLKLVTKHYLEVLDKFKI